MPWSEICGHGLMKRCLARLIRTGRIGGTYLFYGPPGSDQTTLAFGFVSAVLCEKKDGDFCGNCRACRYVRQRVHSDLIVMEPGKTFLPPDKQGGIFYKIDQFRGMQSMAALSPLEADWKVFVIPQAERMQDAGANSLLKVLEEPYSHSLFVLLTDNLPRLLPTIVSRCQRIRLAPLAPEELAEELMAANGLDREKAETVARVSGGRLGRAQELVGEAWLERRDDLLDLLQSLRSGDRLEILHRSQAWKGDRAVARELLVALLGLLRDALVLSTAGGRTLLLNADRADDMASIWQEANDEEIIAAFEAAVDGLDGLDRNLNVQNVLEGIFTACAGPQA